MVPIKKGNETAVMAIGLIIIMVVLIFLFVSGLEAEEGPPENGNSPFRYYVSCSRCEGPNPLYAYNGYNPDDCREEYDKCTLYSCKRISGNCV